MNFNYQIRFTKKGRARFIAHLDTLSVLVRAVRRTGYQLAFSEGMRPKPLLSLAMPLGVGVEGEDEICDFALRQRVPLGEFAKKLAAELPEGFELRSIGPSLDRSKSAARVESVSYRIIIDRTQEGDSSSAHTPTGSLEGSHSLKSSLDEAAARFNGSDSLVLVRHRPKGDKEVDVKRYVGQVRLEDDGVVAFDMKVTGEGTARPEEVIELLQVFAGRPLKAARIIRTAISLREEAPPRRPGQLRRSSRRR